MKRIANPESILPMNKINKLFPRSVLRCDDFGIDNGKLELVEEYPTSSRKALSKYIGLDRKS